jgi:hypothetical protein
MPVGESAQDMARETAAPLLGEEARKAHLHAWFRAYRAKRDFHECLDAAFAALEPLVAVLVAEREKTVRERLSDRLIAERDACDRDWAATYDDMKAERDEAQAALGRVRALLANPDGTPHGGKMRITVDAVRRAVDGGEL